jgi:putative ABC transport system substrate-binding protein
MKRRALGVIATVLGLVVPLVAGAQPAGRMGRIGYLSLVSADAPHHKPWLAAFREGLRSLGYAEGTNLVIEERYAAAGRRIDAGPA